MGTEIKEIEEHFQNDVILVIEPKKMLPISAHAGNDNKLAQSGGVKFNFRRMKVECDETKTERDLIRRPHNLLPFLRQE